ncbi:hypothetical protein PCAR4_840077 [Paraburkholderia caribensis]|nr:hypothetical protein PCAR4_840077 [Paraburkholderia caribensis]
MFARIGWQQHLAGLVGRIACRRIDEVDVNNHDTENEPRLQQPGVFREPRAAARRRRVAIKGKQPDASIDGRA